MKNETSINSIGFVAAGEVLTIPDEKTGEIVGMVHLGHRCMTQEVESCIAALKAAVNRALADGERPPIGARPPLTLIRKTGTTD